MAKGRCGLCGSVGHDIGFCPQCKTSVGRCCVKGIFQPHCPICNSILKI